MSRTKTDEYVRLCSKVNPCCIHRLCNAGDDMACCPSCHNGKYNKKCIWDDGIF